MVVLVSHWKGKGSRTTEVFLEDIESAVEEVERGKKMQTDVKAVK